MSNFFPENLISKCQAYDSFIGESSRTNILPVKYVLGDVNPSEVGLIVNIKCGVAVYEWKCAAGVLCMRV